MDRDSFSAFFLPKVPKAKRERSCTSNLNTMSGDSHPEQPSDSQASKSTSAEPNTSSAHAAQESLPPVTDRAQLVERARTFLYSPQVRYEDNAAKYTFLEEKGLNDVEIQGLLHELVCYSCYSVFLLLLNQYYI